MATLASIPASPMSEESGWGALVTPPGYAQGDDGRLVRSGLESAAKSWKGPSAYVSALFSSRPRAARSNQALLAAFLFASLSIGLASLLWNSTFREPLLPLFAATGLAAYAFLIRWLSRQKSPTGILAFAERIRRAVAYEGDAEWHKS